MRRLRPRQTVDYIDKISEMMSHILVKDDVLSKIVIPKLAQGKDVVGDIVLLANKVCRELDAVEAPKKRPAARRMVNS